jgi:hypothetical protein
MLQARDHVPHFTVTSIDGARVDYSQIWQRENLLLLSLPDSKSPESEAYVGQVERQLRESDVGDTKWVATREAITEVPRPGVLIADRWGEVAFVAEAQDIAGMPPPGELIEWLRYVQNRCPECEGEAR